MVSLYAVGVNGVDVQEKLVVQKKVIVVLQKTQELFKVVHDCHAGGKRRIVIDFNVWGVNFFVVEFHCQMWADHTSDSGEEFLRAARKERPERRSRVRFLGPGALAIFQNSQSILQSLKLPETYGDFPIFLQVDAANIASSAGPAGRPFTRTFCFRLVAPVAAICVSNGYRFSFWATYAADVLAIDCVGAILRKTLSIIVFCAAHHARSATLENADQVCSLEQCCRVIKKRCCGPLRTKVQRQRHDRKARVRRKHSHK